ncbi:tight adherence protein C [Inquilinus ginsengisoli]|uniref:type II secretion system F family protein n=1 Tax=Inquilinus ginsengisoli TaxID=363840 RepID=UPI003D1BB969
MPTVELIIIVVTACSSLGLLMLGLRGTVSEFRLRRRLVAIADRSEMVDVGNIAWLLPFERVLVSSTKDREEITQALRSAGHYEAGAVLAFAGLRFAAVVLAIIGTGLGLWLMGHWGGMARFLPLAAGGVTYVGAKFALQWRASVRQRRVAAELPFVLDLMLLMLESGVSLDQCFRSIAQMNNGAIPLVRQSIRLLVEDIQRGMPYDQAFDRWADRLGVNGGRELTAMFKQTMLHGTELGLALREFIREFTDKRVSSVRESIGRKTTQMTVVMILFLMPALFIVLCSPAVVTMFRTLKGS